MIISIINKTSLGSFLSSTQEWYQKDSAERIANLTATSLEFAYRNNPIRNQRSIRKG